MSYKHIFFDLDHTLWDFNRSSREALSEIFEHFELNKLNESLNLERFISNYYEINAELWDKYNKDAIDQKELRYTRFVQLMGRFDVSVDQFPHEEIVAFYAHTTPRKPHLIPHAREVLDYLNDKYQLHIITNGFSDVQDVKLKSSHILDYFEIIVTSNDTGYKKPHPEIFDFALRKSQASLDESIMIGDNLETDIKGAQAVNMDHIYFNPEGATSPKPLVQREINSLEELLHIL